MRLAVKDVVAVAGRPLRAGSASRAGVAPEPAHAPVVAHLIEQGARLIGTTRLHELAFGVTGINRFEGTVANPADRSRIPGGSSSGSAASVRLGLADVAIATDTGGSARIPAALCGVVGFKASRQLATDGVLPLAPTLDHVGWCTASAADALRVARALGLAGPAWRVRLPARIGILSGEADAEVRRSFQAALCQLDEAGVEVTELDWPHGALVHAVSTTIILAEAARVHPADRDGYGDDVRARLELGRTISNTEYSAAMALRLHLSEAFSQLLNRADVVACPTTPMAAPPLADAEGPAVAAALVRNTRLDNLTGRPAISLPLASAGLPAGLHLAGRTDGELLAAAVAVERELSQPR
jgi:Asp-tRNA(Asn)/Glu-tRNA(Gln) amidotransferase A subunit family amidase